MNYNSYTLYIQCRVHVARMFARSMSNGDCKGFGLLWQIDNMNENYCFQGEMCLTATAFARKCKLNEAVTMLVSLGRQKVCLVHPSQLRDSFKPPKPLGYMIAYIRVYEYFIHVDEGLGPILVLKSIFSLHLQNNGYINKYKEVVIQR